jgi:hypothetical protein
VRPVTVSRQAFIASQNRRPTARTAESSTRSQPWGSPSTTTRIHQSTVGSLANSKSARWTRGHGSASNTASYSPGPAGLEGSELPAALDFERAPNTNVVEDAASACSEMR